MSLGILNNLSALSAADNLNNTSNSLSNVLQQLSSGSKINSGADDAAGLSLVNGLQANSMALAQSKTNASQGVGLLKVADGALSQVTNLLNRAVTLATEASNGTLNDSQDMAANQEYQSILSEINNIGATTTYNGKTVFGSTTNIFTGDSSTAGSSINSLNIRSLSSANVGDSGGVMSYSSGSSNVFINLSKGGTNASVADSLNSSGTTSINVAYLTKSSDGSAVQSSATITVGGPGSIYANTAQGLVSAINGAGLGLSATFGTAAQAGGAAVADASAAKVSGGGATDTGIIITAAGIGVGGTGTNGQGTVGKLTVKTDTDLLSGTLNIVDSAGKTNSLTLGTGNSTDTIANLQKTINAAGYGVTATVSGGVLTFTSASQAVSVSGINIKDQTDVAKNDTVTTSPVGVMPKGNVFGNLGTFVLADKTDLLTGGTLTVKDQLGVVLSDGTGAIKLGVAGSTDTLANLANTINTLGSAAGRGISATVGADGVTMTITSAGKAPDALTSPDFTSSGVTALKPAVAPAISLTNTPTSNSAQVTTLGTLDFGTSTGAAGYVLAGSLTIDGTAFNIDTTDQGSPAQLATAINAANKGINASYDSTSHKMTFTSTNSQTTVASASLTNNWTGKAGGVANVGGVTAVNTTDSSYYSIAISGSVADSSIAGDGSAGTSNVGMIANSNGSGGTATISYSDAAGQNLSGTNLTNQADAQATLKALNSAISSVAAQDGYIGAQINTLKAVSSVLGTQQQNVIAAQNAVQATDYASAASEMSKYQILSQTGIAALAQANSAQREVTKLLQ